MALADPRVCGESSRFGVPINRLGLVHTREGLLRRGFEAAEIDACSTEGAVRLG